MARTECFHQNFDGAFRHRLRLGRTPAAMVEIGEIVQRHSDIGMVCAEHPLSSFQ